MGRWVQPGSLGSVVFTLGVDGGRCVHFALGVVGFILGRWVHSGLRLGPLGSSGVVGFTCVRDGVHQGLLGSLGFALVLFGFIRVRRVRSGSSLGSLGSSGVVGFTPVRLGSRWVHSGSP